MTDTYDYDAFGNKVNSTGTTPNNYLYRGEQYDSDLGLYYLRARYYNPATGRFLNVDPMAGDGQRRYQYAAADPVNGMDPSGNFVLESYWPLHAPLLIGFGTWSPSWCSNGSGGLFGRLLPPCAPPPPCTGSKCKQDKLGIGVQVPISRAVIFNRLDPSVDPGHTFVYLKDASNTVVSIMSFGPTYNVMFNPSLFDQGKFPGTGRHRLEDANANTWETYISPQQLSAGEQDISNFKASPPYYTKSFNCTTAAVSMAAQIGVNLPNGVGSVWGAGNVANPYTLNQQMTATYGSGQVVSMSTFPRP